MVNPSSNRDLPAGSWPWLPDVLASLVAFVVALPLCIGIAVACGVPAERGLVSGIVGGLVVGVLSGAPLLVSGPAASLIVPVFDVVRRHGLEALGPVVILCGFWQMLAGIFRLGQWFRAVAPAVIHGMLMGIGILILASQLHVTIGSDPRGSFLKDVLSFPGALRDGLRGGGAGAAGSSLVGIATVGLLVAWNRWRPRRLKLVPGHLVSVLVVTATVVAFRIPVRTLDISSRFFDGLSLVSGASFGLLRDPSLIGLSLMFAFVASAATLLTASAIDRRQTHSRTKYNREMFAQGVGNLLTGAIGGLPITGVIVRSSVNVDAGARTRLSTMLHGLWILVFVSVAPEILERIPRATMGAILVYTGYKLIDVRALADLRRRASSELVIALLTLFGVVFVELIVGILLGLAAALLKLAFTFSRLEIRSEPGTDDETHHLHLIGSATFLQVPQLAESLDAVPSGRQLRLHIENLEHIDHACLELLSNWEQRRAGEAGSGLVVQWEELTNRYRRARFVGAAGRGEDFSSSLFGELWAEWKQLYNLGLRGKETALSSVEWIDTSRIRLRIPAAALEDVLRVAAEMLAPKAGKSASELLTIFAARGSQGNVVLGEGVSLPHAAIDGLSHSIAALVTTREPLDLAGERADVFFVLLAPESDPRQHLVSLAHVGRLCHQRDFLSALRATAEPKAALDLLTRADVAFEPDAPRATRGPDARVLAVMAIERRGKRERVLTDLVAEAFDEPVLLSERDGASFELLRRSVEVPSNRSLVVVSIERDDLALLTQLLAEYSRLVGPGLVETYVLHAEPFVRGGKPSIPIE